MSIAMLFGAFSEICYGTWGSLWTAEQVRLRPQHSKECAWSKWLIVGIKTFVKKCGDIGSSIGHILFIRKYHEFLAFRLERGGVEPPVPCKLATTTQIYLHTTQYLAGQRNKIVRWSDRYVLTRTLHKTLWKEPLKLSLSPFAQTPSLGMNFLIPSTLLLLAAVLYCDVSHVAINMVLLLQKNKTTTIDNNFLRRDVQLMASGANGSLGSVRQLADRRIMWPAQELVLRNAEIARARKFYFHFFSTLLKKIHFTTYKID